MARLSYLICQQATSSSRSLTISTLFALSTSPALSLPLVYASIESNSGGYAAAQSPLRPITSNNGASIPAAAMPLASCPIKRRLVHPSPYLIARIRLSFSREFYENDLSMSDVPECRPRAHAIASARALSTFGDPHGPAFLWRP